MSVIIKYMDLPKSCNDCPFCAQKFATYEDESWGDMCLAMTYKIWDDERLVNHYEDEDGEYLDFDIESGRHPDCPMRERRKPHKDRNSNQEVMEND